ncbi:hypothetical protein DEI99_014365 [Curtobacterium sp. MCLR17_036]|uniref:hypothetical protein n=1 Tax=Curtobacterium sp. MCLR17_036 TaxID=2175620 RepID=UPI000DA9A08A|nr:hypothetical protein [Curtobacterium sp. MCLR17_036]WIE64404.1 hypothetical protein DEI99_014365 [Curtobacterium sp. MCLR17_036]
MTQTTIYRTEPMATRALGAEIRHDHERFVQLLERVSGKQFGTFQKVECEVPHKDVETERGTVRLDVELTFEHGTVGIEAKLDHELTGRQVAEQLEALGGTGTLFVLVPRKESLGESVTDDERVHVIDWDEALACFDSPRLVKDDIEGEGRLLKTTVEARLQALGLRQRMPDWDVRVQRGDGGMPSIVFERALHDGEDAKWIRGQIQVTGRGMPPHLDDTEFEGFVGISVSHLSEADFPDPEHTGDAPSWIRALEVLDDEVLTKNPGRVAVSLGSAGNGRKGLGKHKLRLAKRHLTGRTHLARGYADWSIGPKTEPVGLDDLDALVETMIPWSNAWYQALQGTALAPTAQ